MLTWNISLTDDQDEVSEKFLMMNDEPIINEKFGPAISTVSASLRKLADDLFKPLEINTNEIFDLINTKASWILPSSYQEYLKTIPQNVSTYYLFYNIYFNLMYINDRITLFSDNNYF